MIRALGGLATALAAAWLSFWLSVGAAHAEPVAYLEAVPVVASPTCAGVVSAEAQVTPVQIESWVDDGVRVAIHYDAGVYDGSCALTVTAAWTRRTGRATPAHATWHTPCIRRWAAGYPDGTAQEQRTHSSGVRREDDHGCAPSLRRSIR